MTSKPEQDAVTRGVHRSRRDQPPRCLRRENQRKRDRTHVPILRREARAEAVLARPEVVEQEAAVLAGRDRGGSVLRRGRRLLRVLARVAPRGDEYLLEARLAFVLALRRG